MASPEDPPTEVLEADASAAAAALVAPPAPAAARTLIGRTLGKFALVEQLGRGGSGDVFRAEQAQLGRSAVIKVLRREGGNAGTRVERFLREARLASRLDHPYAAHIYAFGAESDGVLWIAMEHVRGATLDELIARRGAMPASIFAPLFGRLCEVLHTAHELGIVHRDIKGSNVMVIERAGQLLPKLIDLGIAKQDAMPEPAPDATPAPPSEPLDHEGLTQRGATLGSPHYMAPEQWTDASEVDARADIYALGALAYRCLAGMLPFRHTDRKALAMAHQREPPPPLPDGVVPALGDAVLRALEKDPGARWQTALAFGEAVRFAVGASAPEAVPIFDPYTRDVWLRAGPQPIADAVARLAAAGTTVEADAAVRELVAITCRWLAVVALAGLPGGADAPAAPEVRERARGVVGRDDAGPWLELARVAVGATAAHGGAGLPGLTGALAGSDELAALASRLDDRDRPRTPTTLANDVESAAEALRPIEPLLAYQLVVGGDTAAESWQGPRRRDREPVVVWGEPLAAGEVALLDATGRVVARLSPLAQVIAPLPSAEPELFLLWRSGRGAARLVAAPWGFERDDDAAGRRLAALTTEDSDTAHDPADDVSPYPGLAAYGVADAERFVGREREVEALANRLIRAPMIAVLGPSGAGKSSFIHAGVLPRLAEHYRIVTLRPGRHPMHALAALPEISLVGGDSQDGASIAARLRELGESAPRGLVIVIDQLEELVTLCGDPDERRRFADTLAAAADASSAPVRVVVTLRDDFAAVIESETAFRGRFEVFVLGTPLPETLRRIVALPARRAAVSVDPAVVDDIVAEVAGRPASLPLLSFTTAQLWAARDKVARRITRASYLALGGVAGALSTYADQIYDSLARRDQDIVRALFARLVAGDGTRIPAPRRELEQLPGASAVLAHLIDARLLVVREDDGKDLVELVHECLAERWDRLARWRREDAADRALLGDVRAAARRWLDTGRRPDALWRGEALAELRRLVEPRDASVRSHPPLGRSVALTDDERAFADASIAAARRTRRLRRGAVVAAMAGLTAVAGVMAALGAAARDSAAEARASTTLAEDRLTASYLSQGISELNDGRAIQALPYFAAVLQRGTDTRAVRLLVGFAGRAWPHEAFVLRGAGIHAIAGSPRGELVAADQAGKLRWWTAAGAPAGELDTYLGATQPLRYAGDDLIAIGPTGVAVVDAQHHLVRRVTPPRMPWAAAVGPAADEITLVDSDGATTYGGDGTVRRKLAMTLDSDATNFAFDASGRHLLADLSGTITVFDLVDGSARVVDRGARAQLFAADAGSVFGYLDRGRTVHLIDGTGAPLLSPAFSGLTLQIVFSPTGDRVGLATDHDLAVFDRAGKRLGTTSLEIEPSAMFIRGDDVWVASTDGTTRRFTSDGSLVSSWPLSSASVDTTALAGDLFAALLPDGTLVAQRASGSHRVRDAQVCDSVAYGPSAFAVGYQCAGDMHVLFGRHLMGVVANDTSTFSIAYDDASDRAAITNAGGITAFDRDAKPIAHDPAHGGPSAFADADHVLVAVPGRQVFRWTISANRWDPVVPAAADASAVIAAPDGLILGHTSGAVERFAGTATVATAQLPGSVGAITRTRDGRWLGVQLTAGAFAILDPTSLAIVRTLEPGDATGAQGVFDPSGDLILRQAHGTMSIWDRATGRDLIYRVDLMYDAMGGRFAPDGRVELDGGAPGLLDIAPDPRPASEIVREIKCRVPLAISAAGHLESATPVCP